MYLFVWVWEHICHHVHVGALREILRCLCLTLYLKRFFLSHHPLSVCWSVCWSICLSLLFAPAYIKLAVLWYVSFHEVSTSKCQVEAGVTDVNYHEWFWVGSRGMNLGLHAWITSSLPSMPCSQLWKMFFFLKKKTIVLNVECIR